MCSCCAGLNGELPIIRDALGEQFRVLWAYFHSVLLWHWTGWTVILSWLFFFFLLLWCWGQCTMAVHVSMLTLRVGEMCCRKGLHFSNLPVSSSLHYYHGSLMRSGWLLQDKSYMWIFSQQLFLCCFLFSNIPLQHAHTDTHSQCAGTTQIFSCSLFL